MNRRWLAVFVYADLLLLCSSVGASLLAKAA